MKDYVKYKKALQRGPNVHNSVDTGLEFTLNKNQLPSMNSIDKRSNESSREREGSLAQRKQNI